MRTLVLRCSLAIPAAAALVGFGVAASAAADPADQAATSTTIASGSGSLGLAGVPFASITFNASKTGSATSGTFVGDLEAVSEEPFAGPITCLDVSRRSVSFAYPVSNVGALPAEDVGAIEFTIVQGATDRIGFVPEPAALDRSCAALPVTPYAYTGTLSVTR